MMSESTGETVHTRADGVTPVQQAWVVQLAFCLLLPDVLLVSHRLVNVSPTAIFPFSLM